MLIEHIRQNKQIDFEYFFFFYKSYLMIAEIE